MAYFKYNKRIAAIYYNKNVKGGNKLEKVVEIRAKDEEEAIKIAISEYKIDSDDEISAEEIKKAKNILGFIKSDGIFKITIKEGKKREIKEKTEKLLALMGLDIGVEVENIEKNSYKINLNGPDNGIIIGKKGKTLNSFEYLMGYIIKGVKLEIDVEEFKEKREATLRELAKKMVEKVISSEKAVKLNPMPPRERRIIHEVVNQYEGIDTYSEGKDPNRYIVIRKKKENEDI